MLDMRSYFAKPSIPVFQAGHPLSWGLTEQWPFCDRSGPTLRNAVSRNDGLIAGGVWQAGPWGPALKLRGAPDNDYIEIPHAPNLAFTDALGIQVSVAVLDFSEHRPLIFKGQAFDNDLDWYVWFPFNAGQPSVYFVTRHAGGYDAFSTSILPAIGVAETWQFSWDSASNTKTIWREGEIIAAGSSTQTGSLVNSATALNIGRYNHGTSWFAGSISDLKLYRRPLTIEDHVRQVADPLGTVRPRSRIIPDLLGFSTVPGGPGKTGFLPEALGLTPLTGVH